MKTLNPVPLSPFDTTATASGVGARVCEPQQLGQPEGAENNLERVENRPLRRLTEPRSTARTPRMKSGNDALTAHELTQLFVDAQAGLRKIIALGLFAWEIKEHELKHGEWGAWLAAHAPELARADSVSGKPKASSQLIGYMELTRSILEACGLKTIGSYLEAVAKFPNAGNLNRGQFLLLPDINVPAEARPLREKIFQLVDGKTQRQLFLEFKQSTADGSRPQRGRLKGSEGCPRHVRAEAANRDELERVTAKKLKAAEITAWLMEMSDDAGLGELRDTEELLRLDEAMETARGYIKHL